jgi:ATP-dependent DNA helicase RecQ
LFLKALDYLHQYFGYSQFRDGQAATIQNILNKQDTVCIMPTGGGKSICYQIPALVFPGTTLVISPLISLMKDQVDTLSQLGISATFINSSLSSSEVSERMRAAKKGEYKLLYIAPERFESFSFLDQLKGMEIPLVAIDEAHCISQWGHDFRPSYLTIAKMIDELPKKPIVLALTATATPNVREDICRILSINQENTVLTGFERSNLSFSVIKGQDNLSFLLDYIKQNGKEAGIIYTATRRATDQLFQRMQKESIKVGRYHAGLSDEERNLQQELFLQDKIQVMVATSAFGMGIDKSNIRYVIHDQIPKSMESYYQEAGRAGRDGLDSQCIVLYQSQSVQIQRFIIDQAVDRTRITSELEKLQHMVDYCHTESCLQVFILDYFGESDSIPCGRCSNCTDTRQTKEVTVDAQMVLSCVMRMGQRFGKTMVAQVLTGSKNKKIIELGFSNLKTYGIMNKQSLKEVTDFIEFLISEDFLEVEHGAYPTIKVTGKGKEVLLSHLPVQRKEVVRGKQILKEDPLFEELRLIRRELAEQEKVPPFVIFSDQTLQDMCIKLPQSKEEMLNVKGVGSHKLGMFGDTFISAIESYLVNNPDRKQEDVVLEVVTKSTKKSVEKNSHLLTFQLYKENFSIAEISRKRELSTITVENHLIKCDQEGLHIDWDQFIPTDYKSLIGEAVREAETEKLKPIKELLPKEISFFMIKSYLMQTKKELI